MLKILISNSNIGEVKTIRVILKQLSQSMKIPAIISGFTNPNENLPQISRNMPETFDYDIVFLNLDDTCNLEYGTEIRRLTQTPAIIVSSAALGTVQSAMRLRPSMFFVGIEDTKTFARQIAYIFREMENNNFSFMFNCKDEIIRIPYENILYFENNNRYVTIHTSDSRRKYSFVSKIDEVINILPKNIFIKCHQSFIVNKQKIKAVNKITKQFVLVSGDVIDISRRRYQDAINTFMCYDVKNVACEVKQNEIQ